jgi:hypothetical protein
LFRTQKTTATIYNVNLHDLEGITIPMPAIKERAKGDICGGKRQKLGRKATGARL